MNFRTRLFDPLLIWLLCKNFELVSPKFFEHATFEQNWQNNHHDVRFESVVLLLYDQRFSDDIIASLALSLCHTPTHAHTHQSTPKHTHARTHTHSHSRADGCRTSRAVQFKRSFLTFFLIFFESEIKSFLLVPPSTEMWLGLKQGPWFDSFPSYVDLWKRFWWVVAKTNSALKLLSSVLCRRRQSIIFMSLLMALNF